MMSKYRRLTSASIRSLSVADQPASLFPANDLGFEEYSFLAYHSENACQGRSAEVILTVIE